MRCPVFTCGRLGGCRWFKNHETLESAWTSNVVAADLNAILYKVEVHMAEFYSMVSRARLRAHTPDCEAPRS